MAGRSPKVVSNEFEIYSIHVLIPPTIETGEPELNTIADKYQDKGKFILNNTFSDVK